MRANALVKKFCNAFEQISRTVFRKLVIRTPMFPLWDTLLTLFSRFFFTYFFNCIIERTLGICNILILFIRYDVILVVNVRASFLIIRARHTLYVRPFLQQNGPFYAFRAAEAWYFLRLYFVQSYYSWLTGIKLLVNQRHNSTFARFAISFRISFLFSGWRKPPMYHTFLEVVFHQGNRKDHLFAFE